jgi:MmyB-like transcription regulator ligand binding domain
VLCKCEVRCLLEPAARELYVNWDEAIENLVRGSHEVTVSDPNDPKLSALIDDLSAFSRHLRELWARGDVGYLGGIVHMRRPRWQDSSAPR